jgi:predicted metal-dependent hydrolase
MKETMINQIPVIIERKNIKNMYLRILEQDGKIKITAPMRVKEQEIFRFIYSKLAWIEKHREQQMQCRQQSLRYETGEELFLWGRKYRLVNVEAIQKERIELTSDEVILYSKPGSTIERRKQILDRWYKALLEQEIPGFIAKWESKLGVKAGSWKIRNMKTRWGSCNIRTKGICLNLQLAKKPLSCLEYVVVHELVHLLEASHNQVFQDYMSKYLPDWRMIKKVLNEKN